MYEKIKEYSIVAFFILLFCTIIYGTGYVFGARGKQEQLEQSNREYQRELNGLEFSISRLEDRNRELVYKLADATKTAHRITDIIEQATERIRTITNSRERIELLLNTIEKTLRELKEEYGEITEINRERAIEE